MPKPKTIFVIEDEKAIVQAIAEHLRNEGYVVDVAYNGEDALKMMPTVRPDLIVLDIVLPEVNGVTFVKEIQKEGSESAKIPIIVLTNLPDGIETFRTMGLKVDGYFVKVEHPLSDLSKKIKEILK